MYFKGDYTLRKRDGDYHVVEIMNIRYKIRNRYYLMPQFYIEYTNQNWPNEWVWMLYNI